MKKALMCLVILCGMAATGLRAQFMKLGDTLKGSPAFLPGEKIKVLEFWSTHCASCIRGFPRLQSLQEKFEGQLEILLVNSESTDMVEGLFRRQKKMIRPSLRFINGDTILKKQFDDIPLPFQAWIDSNGVVLAITGTSDLNEDLVRAMLKGNNIAVKTKLVRKVPSSLVEGGIKQWGAKVNYYSYLAECSDKIMVGYERGRAAVDGKVRLSQDCARLRDLYKVAYSEKGKFTFYHPFNLKLDVADKSLFDSGRYSYDLIVPQERSSVIFPMMQQDLERYFGFKAVVSRDQCKVLELTGQPGPNLIATKGGKAIVDARVSGNLLLLKLQNQPFDTLISVLRRYLPPSPILLENRSSYSNLGDIDISLEVNLNATAFLESIITELRKFNLQLFVHNIPMDVLTVTDK